MVQSPNTSKVSQVKMVYEKPDSYLSRRRYNINIRAETVQHFVNNTTFERILDIGCGDGSMSLTLLSSKNRLTLVDISGSMLSIARSRIPSGLLPNVEIVNEDFMSAKLVPRSYDLILCIGVLAHADSPSALVDKVTSLLRPGGTVVMESTDANHFTNRAAVLYHRLLGLLRRPTYALNLVSAAKVIEMYRSRGLKLSAIYRYNLPAFPGMDRFVPQKVLQAMVRMTYGTPKHNRNAWLGKECLYRLKDDGARE
jgi:2-polyprenyl-3-methyl-5-hydroxy-6-metoxy-1,4-benzoquinol methylase